MLISNNKLEKENEQLRDEVDGLRRLLYELNEALDSKAEHIIELNRENRNLKDKLELAEYTIEKQKYIIELLENNQ